MDKLTSFLQSIADSAFVQSLNTFFKSLAVIYAEHPYTSIIITLLIIFLGREPLRRFLEAVLDIVLGIIGGPTKLLGQLVALLHSHAANGARVFKEQWGNTVLASLAIAIPVACVAIASATANYFLMLRPFSEIFGAYAIRIGPYVVPVANLGAFVIVGLEFLVGLVLMNAIRWTPFFPKAEHNPNPPSKTWIIGLAAVLLLFSFVEVGLAYNRELLIEQEEAFRRSLSDLPGITETARTEETRAPLIDTDVIPTSVQAIIGFIMPWVLTLVSHIAMVIFGALPIIVLFSMGVAVRIVYHPLAFIDAFLTRIKDAFLAAFDFIVLVIEKITLPIAMIFRWLRRREQVG